MKVCARCCQEKPLQDFHIHPGGKLGRHPICKLCRGPDTRRAALKSKCKLVYGISLEEYNRLFEQYNYECCICGNVAVCLDHNHITGEIRGILCHPCNQAIGLLRDSPDLLRKAATYLEVCANGKQPAC